MKFYNFLLLTKWKGKKVQMRDKVGTEIFEMKVVKWEEVWNDDREQKNGESEQIMQPHVQIWQYHTIIKMV